MKNKRGWIRIVEAFVAILLITGVILMVVNRGDIQKSEDNSKIHEIEISILREIELNDNLRQIILKIDSNQLPLKWGNENFPVEITKVISSRTPENLGCAVNICELDSICGMEEYVAKDVYAQKIIIAATLEIYNPRQLKLFCWRK